MGKGTPAALIMATARATLRAVVQQHSPAAALQLVRQALEDDLEHAGSFVTLFHARLDVAARALVYVDAGHGHGFIRRADGASEELQQGGPPIGVPAAHPYREGTVTFQPRDTLVVYSDGLLEARPDLSLDPRTIAQELGHAHDAATIVDVVVALAGVTGPPPDDLTVVALHCAQT